MLDIDLRGRRALVTGGNSGIGAAIVASLAAAGADVAINYLSHPEAAEAGADGVRQAGGRALTLMADITDSAAVNGMFARLDAEWGRLDILVNNAGLDGPPCSPPRPTSPPGGRARSQSWAPSLARSKRSAHLQRARGHPQHVVGAKSSRGAATAPMPPRKPASPC